MAKPTVSEVATAMRAAVGDLTPEELRIVVATYRKLAQGDPVSPADVAARAGVDEAAVRAFYDAKPGVYRDDNGSVIGFWGLALQGMPHGFQIDGGKPIRAWCAVDPFLIVPVIGAPATVRSTDPTTGETVMMTATPDGVLDLTPPGAVTSFVIPNGPFDHDVIATFCHSVHHFASEQSGREWTDEHPGTILYTVHEAFEIGRRAWAPIIDAAALAG